MSCKVSERDWQLYLAGDMSSSRLRKFELHLKSCPVCQARLEEFEQSRQITLSQLPELDAITAADEINLDRAVARALDSKEQAPRARLNWATALGAAALVVIIIATVWFRPGVVPTQSADAGQSADLPDKIAAAAVQPEHYELRMNTSDPKVKIVWVFDKNLKL